MQAIEVQPRDWLKDNNYPIRVLYDDGDYSIIWGKYIDTRSLGVRWNGGTERGFPGQGAHPTWYVEPDFIAAAIINRLLTINYDLQNIPYLEDILFAQRELMDKMQGSNL